MSGFWEITGQSRIQSCWGTLDSAHLEIVHQNEQAASIATMRIGLGVHCFAVDWDTESAAGSFVLGYSTHNDLTVAAPDSAPDCAQ